MTSLTHARPIGLDESFSPVDNEPPLRWQRRLRLAPAHGLGVARRAVCYALLAWLPIAVWAAATGHLWFDQTGERLLQHYGVNVRCLIAIPLFIIGESALQRAWARMMPQLLEGGIVASSERERFDALLDRMRRLRDTSLPWILIIGIVVAWSIGDQPDSHADAMAWALQPDGTLGFGEWWFAYVARPLFLALLLAWLWRLVLVALFLARLQKLPLSLVPTHPDRTGGIGFIEKLPAAFTPVTCAISAVIASQWAHEMLYHGAKLESFAVPIAVFVVIWSLLLMAPLLVFVPLLAATKRTSLAAYGALVGTQGRLVYRRWIQNEPIADAPLLDAPEIGPVADANSMYTAIKDMRPVPIGKGTLLAILLPMLLPMFALAALQVPLKGLLKALLKAVI